MRGAGTERFDAQNIKQQRWDRERGLFCIKDKPRSLTSRELRGSQGTGLFYWKNGNMEIVKVKQNTKFIFDVDTGSDDALAIMYADARGIIPEYIITSYGNVSLTSVTKNTSMVLDAIGNTQTKVIEGLANPIGQNLGRVDDYSGLCGVNLPGINQSRVVGDLSDNIDRILKLSSMTYVVLGPCSNLAWILKNYPDIKSKIDQVVIMGGGLTRKGNITPYAEFNFFQDPVAVNVVIASDLPVYLVTLDATVETILSASDIEKSIGSKSSGFLVSEILRGYFNIWPERLDDGYELFDPLTIGAILGFLEFTPENVRVKTNGLRKGELVVSSKGYVVNVPTLVDGGGFVSDFINRISETLRLDRQVAKSLPTDLGIK